MAEMDLEALDYASRMYGAQMQRESAREANETNIRLAREARQFSAQEAGKQMSFQKEMSSTAHQREMADLIAAGLNPILTATGGGGAAMGSGAMAHSAMAQVDPVQKDNPLEGLSQSAYQARRFKELELKQLELNARALDKTIEVQDTVAAKNLVDAMQGQSQISLNSAREATEYAQQGYLGAQAKYISNLDMNAVLDSIPKSVKAEYLQTPIGKNLTKIGEGVKSVAPAVTGAAGLGLLLQRFFPKGGK